MTSSSSLESLARSYALMATAACAGVLAIPSNANAEVIYTPANVVLTNGQVSIDLNGDGITDFTLLDHDRAREFYSNRILALSGDVGAFVVKTNGRRAAVLNSGSVVSSRRVFEPAYQAAPLRLASVGYRCPSTSYCYTVLAGSWKLETNKYLGLKFKINNEVHYGWARLSTNYLYKASGRSKIKVQLTGYAYESVPGAAITAGETNVANPPVTNGTLGALARGASK